MLPYLLSALTITAAADASLELTKFISDYTYNGIQNKDRVDH